MDLVSIETAEENDAIDAALGKTNIISYSFRLIQQRLIYKMLHEKHCKLCLIFIQKFTFHVLLQRHLRTISTTYP